jgi:hypothetical protein
LSNCDPNAFIKTYYDANGFLPSKVAWATWVNILEKMEQSKRAQQHEYQRVVERETKERPGTGSRLLKWSSTTMEYFPGSGDGYSSSSSDASTKVASSRNSEVCDERAAVMDLFGSYGQRRIEGLQAQKPWKDVTDKTWAFGEPLILDDPQYHMAHVQNPGKEVRDPGLK